MLLGAPVCEAVPGLGITLDVGHAELVALGTSCEVIKSLGAAIRHVHLHDNQGGNLTDDLHLPIGAGIIDFEGILKDLLRVGYSGTMTLEILSSHLSSSRERLRGLIATLIGSEVGVRTDSHCRCLECRGTGDG